MSQFTRVLSSILFFAISSISATASALQEIAGGGVTYAIAEQDALEEIKERGQKADVKGYVNKTPRSDWSAWDGYPLPRATLDRVRNYVPWYRLEFNITDAKGSVIYPEGFMFNPLEHIKLPQRVVIFKLDQLQKLKPRLKAGDMLIADTGDVVEAGNKLGAHIYILNEKLAKRFGVEVVPSIITQDDKQFEIIEVDLSDD